MRRSLIRLGAVSLTAISLGAIVHACGFSAGIIVNQVQYDHTEFVTTSRCGDDNNAVDLVYILLDNQLRLMGDTSPIFSNGAADVQVEIPDPLDIEGQTAKLRATVGETRFVQVTRLGQSRAITLLMDNSRSFDGYDEDTGTRPSPVVLPDPNNRRISGAQRFIGNSNAIFPSASGDRATLIAYHGDGPDGVFPKMRNLDDEAPNASWFVFNTDFFKQKLLELRNEVSGKTPLYDAIDLGLDAMASLPGNPQKVMIAFGDGPDNSSRTTITDAQGALTEARVPFHGIFLRPPASLSDAARNQRLQGEANLRTLACASQPRGAVAVAETHGELDTKFVQMSYLLAGYWKTSLSLTREGGALPAGTYKVTGKLYADPRRTPKECDPEVTKPCGEQMLCDNRDGMNQGRCYTPISFTYSTN